MHEELQKLWKIEDYWAVWLGLGIVLLALAVYSTGGTITGWAVKPGSWSTLGALGDDFAKHVSDYLIIFAVFGVVFTISMVAMGRKVGRFIPGFTILFLGSTAIFYLSSNSFIKAKLHLGAPLLALIIGLVIGNLFKLPEWFHASLLTEYYIKTGIVLLGATLPLTLIFNAGPIAFLQATIVSVCTWLTIFFAATKIFGLEKQFGAVLGAGGAVCGVSASIAVGGAVKAKKDHIAISIAIVSVWAIVMILVLSVVVKWMVPVPISPGEAGAWTGTSEFADAAGFAVVAELADVIESGAIRGVDGEMLNPDDPINTFTLMKVIGRDIWIGIWCLILAVVSVVFWEKRDASEKAVGAGIIWERFPKFVLGFFLASIIMTLVSSRPPVDWVGTAPLRAPTRAPQRRSSTTLISRTTRFHPSSAGRVTITDDGLSYANAGEPMTLHEYRTSEISDSCRRHESPGQARRIQTASLRLQLVRKRPAQEGHHSNQGPALVGLRALLPVHRPVDALCGPPDLRTQTVLGVHHRVAVNVPLGYFLSTVVFSRFWSNISSLM